MTHTSDAEAILSHAHDELRELLGRALQDHSYDDVVRIARIAEQVSRLLDRNGSATTATYSAAEGVATAADYGTSEGAEHVAAVRPSGRPRSRHRTLPRFERDDDRLVKVAWSKRDRREYEHRAPREIVSFLLDAIRRNKGEGAVFESQHVLPLVENGREIPSYQAYLALAWLREEGIVKKKGRNGYILKPNTATSERIDELWQALPATQR
jgi:hypothetical protein